MVSEADPNYEEFQKIFERFTKTAEDVDGVGTCHMDNRLYAL